MHEQALLEICESDDVPFHEISNAAQRLNALFGQGVHPIDGEERRVIFERFTSIMSARIHEANATDLSRLAWLYLHLWDDATAKGLTKKALSLEPENSHCLKLAVRLGI